MGALPKKKITKRRGRTRIAHQGISIPTPSRCSECNSPFIPHRICPNCGYYNKKLVLAKNTSNEENPENSENSEN